jgi:serine phosphatase RsbU (regulator of sigma subunit)
VLYARLAAREGGGFDMTLATGGHMPPRILRADGSLDQVELRGSIVGGLRTPVFAEVDAQLAQGDVLVMFTDGVTELRGHAPGEGERLLDELLAQHAGESPAAVAQAIETSAVALQRGEPRDDIAILTARPVT